MFDTPLNIDNATIYRFRIIGNYDDGTIGSLGTALDNEKTKFLICEDVAEADNADHPRHGYRYLVMRPKYLWNATSPKFYIGSTVDGDNPARPKYSLNDEIRVIALFAESINPSEELTYSADLKTYIKTFHNILTPIMNWNEIDTDLIVKLYFVDLNLDGRTRESGGESSCSPVIVSSPSVFPPPGTKTAIVKNDFLNSYHSMFCIEGSEVLFQDIIKVECCKSEQIPVPQEFLAICEVDSIVVSSITCDLPISVGVFVKNGLLYLNNPSNSKANLILTLSGTRKGFIYPKYHSVSQKAFYHNNKFWTSWQENEL